MRCGLLKRLATRLKFSGAIKAGQANIADINKVRKALRNELPTNAKAAREEAAEL
jgi:hypothetical protein